MYQASGLLDIQGFDEPGAFGLYSILLLYLIKFTFKMQKELWLILQCLPFH
jgi:hypothetical protein